MANNRATHEHHRPSGSRGLDTLDTFTQHYHRGTHQRQTIKMGKTGGEGGGAQQMMYGFIFVMYAVTAGVLFYVMFNRYVVSVTNHLMME